MTQIWVDADACPNVIKEVLYRAAERAEIHLTLIANQTIKIPRSAYIHAVKVKSGFDVADNEIVKRVNAGDLVVTADIPLAAEVLDKQGVALNPRGELYTEATIKERLTLRDFMDTMRASGIQTGGPAGLSQKDRQLFANQLDKWLQQLKKQ